MYLYQNCWNILVVIIHTIQTLLYLLHWSVRLLESPVTWDIFKVNERYVKWPDFLLHMRSLRIKYYTHKLCMHISARLYIILTSVWELYNFNTPIYIVTVVFTQSRTWSLITKPISTYLLYFYSCSLCRRKTNFIVPHHVI